VGELVKKNHARVLTRQNLILRMLLYDYKVKRVNISELGDLSTVSQAPQAIANAPNGLERDDQRTSRLGMLEQGRNPWR
jgi:hypothetical protein